MQSFKKYYDSVIGEAVPDKRLDFGVVPRGGMKLEDFLKTKNVAGGLEFGDASAIHKLSDEVFVSLSDLGPDKKNIQLRLEFEKSQDKLDRSTFENIIKHSYNNLTKKKTSVKDNEILPHFREVSTPTHNVIREINASIVKQTGKSPAKRASTADNRIYFYVQPAPGTKGAKATFDKDLVMKQINAALLAAGSDVVVSDVKQINPGREYSVSVHDDRVQLDFDMAKATTTVEELDRIVRNVNANAKKLQAEVRNNNFPNVALRKEDPAVKLIGIEKYVEVEDNMDPKDIMNKIKIMGPADILKIINAQELRKLSRENMQKYVTAMSGLYDAFKYDALTNNKHISNLKMRSDLEGRINPNDWPFDTVIEFSILPGGKPAGVTFKNESVADVIGKMKNAVVDRTKMIATGLSEGDYMFSVPFVSIAIEMCKASGGAWPDDLETLLNECSGLGIMQGNRPKGPFQYYRSLKNTQNARIKSEPEGMYARMNKEVKGTEGQHAGSQQFGPEVSRYTAG